MNLSKLSFILLIALFWSSCGDDDDAMKTCTQADWVGTYAGTITCDSDVEDVTVTITASGSDAIIIEYATTNVTTTLDPMTPNNCDFGFSGMDSGVTLTADAALDGDEFTYTEVFSGGGFSSTCNITATRN